MNYKIAPLWPTFIGEFQNEGHKEIKNDIIKFIDDYIKNNKSRAGQENLGLFESDYKLHLLNHTSFNSILEFICNSVKIMSDHANRNFLINQKKRLEVVVNDSWFIKYENKTGFVLPHTHGNCSWCCVYYVQIGENASLTNGSTYFQTPSYKRYTRDFGNLYRGHDVQKVIAKEGNLLVWPNDIYHGSLPYTGDTQRIIISANLQVFELNENGERILSF